MRILIFLVLLPFLAHSQQQVRVINLPKDAAEGEFIYTLPFEHKKKVFLIQGYETIFSHRKTKALDFKVKKGTKICAAREGIVIATKSDSNKRGLKDENIADGNYIAILHADGTVGHYWHLKKDGVLVKTDDKVAEGQLIGYSGNTGYSAFPHLHFEVRGYDAQGNYTTLPTRFYTQKGITHLRCGKFYRSLHE